VTLEQAGQVRRTETVAENSNDSSPLQLTVGITRHPCSYQKRQSQRLR
jgi:hypothetical protein